MRARLPSNLRTSDPQSVTFVELFFDLVFVFAVTQITALTAHDLTPDGVLRSILLGWLIWWAWTQFTWTLNPGRYDPSRRPRRDPGGDGRRARHGGVGHARFRR